MAISDRAAIRRTKQPEIRKGDVVVVLTGKDAGKRGEVERVLTDPVGSAKVRGAWKRIKAHSYTRVVVDGLNIAKRHTKPRTRQGRTDRQPRVQQGGILEVAQPMSASNVMIVCPNCGVPTRVRHTELETGARMRVCTHCASALDRGERASKGVRS
ncbi:MAG: LSU ribosomal protein L24p (L26e) [uncultured Solirubrobacteraceae bacterium]|uniref:Large ribosomal subunit protein uL24 n=1 Tax=uncultured Solirubrobacteraceae bacterium TaxID=1162706 RepID=A0A6J4TLE5_9ACTN|nr:MAG: LSU ribosomal protein L24p (L26e) [uncultured Solirubrobacteraceae bacterium]